MRDRLQDLRESLLRAGLAPRHVERYLRELAEHRDDIAAHLIQTGLTPSAAQRQAALRLGDHDTLLMPMLVDRRIYSRAARWPALCYLVLPLATQAAVVLAGVLALVVATATGLRPAIADLGRGTALLLLAAPIGIAWLTLFAACRRRAALRWPLLGAVAGAGLAAALQLVVIAPGPATGRIELSLGLPSPLPLLVLTLASLLPLVLRRRPG
tara:strand:+ start:395 stop:1030 length:636 start_codon:yes stop_codon:yes gene_type:complete